MNYDGFAVTGAMLLMLFTTSVMAGSNVEYGGKLYQFRDSGSAVSADDAPGSRHKFRPIQRHSGANAPAGRSIGGAAENGQGYVFRPLRNRRRWASGSEQDPRENVQACPAIEEKPKQQKFSTPAYTPYRPRQRYQDGYGSPLPPAGGYINPLPGVPGYPRW